MHKLKQHILRRDVFGHPSHFNFMKKGTHYQTCCGGTVTIIFLSFLTWMLAEKFVTMFNYENDTIINNFEIANFEEIGTVKLDE